MENILSDKYLEASWTAQVLKHECFAPSMSEAHKKNTLEDLTSWTQFLQ